MSSVITHPLFTKNGNANTHRGGLSEVESEPFSIGSRERSRESE
jgi:hypothetical protein